MSSDEKVLDFPRVEVTPEENARRVMVEATRLASLAPGEWRLWIDRTRYEFHPIGRNAQATVVQASSDLDLDHVQNFLECMRSRKLPNGDVLVGHRSAQASHLGNLSYMQKRRIDFDPVREEILPF